MKKVGFKHVWICMILIISVFLSILTGCASRNIEPEPSSSPSVSNPVSKPIDVIEDIPDMDIDIDLNEKICNPLTGLYDMKDGEETLRPVAVMINNIKKAWPQSGIGSAEILYEMEVEGGITRMMAVFSNIGRIPEKLGSVRSMRPYYINLAGGHDALFVGHGWSKTAQNILQKEHVIDFINANNGNGHGNAFYRDNDKAKSKGREHSSYTTRDRLQKVVKAKNMRTKLDSDRVGQKFIDFNKPEEAKAVGKSCISLNVPFSNYAKSQFIYDEQKKLYLKEEFSGKHIDEATGKQLGFTNVLVLFMPVSMEDEKHLIFDFSTPDSGYYASLGKIQEIKWKKGKEYDKPFRFQTADGQPLTINAGKTMICIVRKTRKNNVSFEGASKYSERIEP